MYCETLLKTLLNTAADPLKTYKAFTADRKDCTLAERLMLGTHYPCSRPVYGPWTRVSFWTPVNTGHRDRQALLLMTS